MNFPKRKSARLKNFGYNMSGVYFITICTHNRKCILSDINVGEGLCALPSIILTPIGEAVEKSIKYINKNYKNVIVENFVIMPNHIHLIIKMNTGGHGDPPLRVYDIIGDFKSFTTHEYGKKLWQRSFYDHIIRDEMDYIRICEYIENNPSKWEEDKLYVK